MFQTLFRVSDNAISVLFKMFVRELARIVRKDRGNLESVCELLPQDIQRARLCVSANRDNFRKYTCCPKCFSLYWKFSSDSLQCTYVQFPQHPRRHHRNAGGSHLYKEVKFSSGKVTHYPFLTFCYKSVTESLQDMLTRQHFLKHCEAWRSRKVNEGEYGDVYDGKVWKEFAKYDGQPFLSLPFNYALQLNIDWFQPYEHTQHSEGVMYLTITSGKNFIKITSVGMGAAKSNETR